MDPAGSLERLVDRGLVLSPNQDVDVVVGSSEPADPQVDGPAAEEPVLQLRRVQCAGSTRDHRQSSIEVTRLLSHPLHRPFRV